MPLLREHIWHKHPKGPVPLLLLTNLDTIHLVMVQWMLDKQERHQVHDIEPADDSIRIRGRGKIGSKRKKIIWRTSSCSLVFLELIIHQYPIHYLENKSKCIHRKRPRFTGKQ
nr:hypothetical protein Iba_chr12cCG8970 [Ipomoea batatas]